MDECQSIMLALQKQDNVTLNGIVQNLIMTAHLTDSMITVLQKTVMKKALKSAIKIR
jgi:hypothetical protein